MSRFFVRFRVETLASIAEKIEQQKENRPIWKISWSVIDARLVAYDALRDVNGIFIHEGIGLDMNIPGENLDAAIDRAQNLAEGLVNLISYVTTAGCKPATLISSYEISERQTDVDVVWFTQDSPHALLGDLRPIDSRLLNLVYKKYDAADEDKKWRISQAAQWLRKGILELETIGQFIAFWNGLEVSSRALLDLLGSAKTDSYPMCPSCKSQILICPDCEADLGRKDTMAGVAEMFEKHIARGRQTYKRIRSNRGRLLHGGKKLKPEFLADLRNDLPIVRKALSVAIGLCLGIEEVDIKRIAEMQPRRAMRPLAFKIFGKLIAFSPPSLDTLSQQPMLEHKLNQKYSVTPEGNLEIAFDHTITMHNASFHAERYEVRGDEHAKGR